ncbi:hypothetical protein [Streptomyces flavofungini]|uniref:hypothetical protein n=1 Tax=Streptomyces flavofungini TaxID=68200 RepID=UPI0034DEC67B
MNEIVNAEPVALAVLGSSSCLLFLIIGVVWIAYVTVQADDRKHLSDCFRALGELVRSFRR